MRAFNVRGGELEHEGDRPGYRWRATRVGDRLGSTQIGGSIYELPDGEQTFPYHFHHGVEEWLLVVEGEPTVRTPTGERVLRSGDVLCFPAGPEGAHVVRGPGRILILSANRAPSISIYPDSDKVGTRPGTGADDDRLNFRRSDAVSYWEGE